MLRSLARRAAISSASPAANPHTLGPFQIFDRDVKRIQKNRAALREGSRMVDYVQEEVADRMMERFMDIKRTFDTVLDLGSGPGHFTKLLEPERAKKAVMIDSSDKALHRDPDSEFEVQVERICGDEENLLQIVDPNSQEAIVSCLSLHWVNDLPGTLVQIREALKPDGLFLGAMFGGDTLFELRTALQLAELEREGGIAPHISPMTQTRDISNLMGRAGFTLLTVDVDEVNVAYPNMWALMDDLGAMGEANAILGPRRALRRDTLAAASAIYSVLHGSEDGSVPATFQVIYMASHLFVPGPLAHNHRCIQIGWKPAHTQPQPLERGTGKVSLKEVL
ncbi:S-adenosyl-L-methionine-dependent methyltransferase [Mycena belliarum]|uniref:S-adenosyl-L-methionine-dependent methyltransferase n=1 Tax=Mycena belliarum TaxID=1033014 RepID=A0AAD6XRX0_9AGAR|nr:S-adenosyl-L-methionine-dependent methyltransferase [Mycena belliae]